MCISVCAFAATVLANRFNFIMLGTSSRIAAVNWYLCIVVMVCSVSLVDHKVAHVSGSLALLMFILWTALALIH